VTSSPEIRTAGRESGNRIKIKIEEVFPFISGKSFLMISDNIEELIFWI